MKRIPWLILLMIFIPGKLPAQDNDTIDLTHFKPEVLERLILSKINSYRQDSGATILRTDSILRLAALDQAEYVKRIRRLDHQQTSLAKSTVKDRVKYYHGQMRGVGENMLMTTIHRPAKLHLGERDTILNLNTYSEVADAMFRLWVNSAVHHHIMTYPKFTCTGLAFAVDSANEVIYAVEVFGYN
ncbi:MAG: hypothetical protein GC181_05425 [Bacteroidetes bacterium]|nr:hypothetical protein [Bacteroidota bacterium]